MLPLLFNTMGLQFRRVHALDEAMTFLKQEDSTSESYLSQQEEPV